jgi:hypothetical protein
VIIDTCNQLEQHAAYKIIKHPPLYINETKQFEHNNDFNKNKNIQPGFKHFGMFIGRGNWIRLWISGSLYRNMRSKILLSYHWTPQNVFHAEHIGLDDMLKWQANIDDISAAVALLSECPIQLEKVDTYPVLSPEHLNICKFYPDFFAEVVCETYYSGKSFFPTEKIWRPLVMKTPFIVHGPVDYLRNLRVLGFRTFDQWWSEEYDDYGHNLRIEKILDLLHDIARMNLSEIRKIYQSMYPTLEHNYQVFMELDSKKFQQLYQCV